MWGYNFKSVLINIYIKDGKILCYYSKGAQ